MVCSPAGTHRRQQREVEDSSSLKTSKLEEAVARVKVLKARLEAHRAVQAHRSEQPRPPGSSGDEPTAGGNEELWTEEVQLQTPPQAAKLGPQWDPHEQKEQAVKFPDAPWLEKKSWSGF